MPDIGMKKESVIDISCSLYSLIFASNKDN